MPVNRAVTMQNSLWRSVLFVIILSLANKCLGNLISSSEIRACAKTSMNEEPMHPYGRKCSKKFVVSLAVQSGQGESGAVYASIKSVDEKNSRGGHEARKRKQLVKPFRIVVTKSDVYVAYPLRHTLKYVNDGPTEASHRWSTNVFHGAFRDLINDRICEKHEIYHCPGYTAEKENGFCCEPGGDERWGHIFAYKRGYGHVASPEWSRTNVMSICATNSDLWWHVYDIGDPYVLYRVNVTVQQLDYLKIDKNRKMESRQKAKPTKVWHTIGYATIGPEMIGDNTNRKKPGVTSGPEVIAEWQGDFASTSSFPNLKTKYLIQPDERYSYSYYTHSHANSMFNTENSAQNLGKFLLIEKHMFDLTGSTCNKIGVRDTTIKLQPVKCFQKAGSCFKFTPRTVFETAKRTEARGIKSHYLPPFYGDFRGIMQTSKGLNLLYRSNQVHQSLITLQFVAESISFVELRSPGRIVEALVEDFMALAGSSSLSVTVQNTGTLTSKYSVSIDDCTDGIIQISEKTKTIPPRQQTTYYFEISSSLNMDYAHNCTVMLTDDDGKVLHTKVVNFNTTEGCVYCPDGQCDCECKPDAIKNLTTSVQCTADTMTIVEIDAEQTNVVAVGLCYYCWFTDTFKDPYTATFTVMVLLMSLGMIKMICCHACCKTKDGRYIDVAGVLLGTTNAEHSFKKKRSATLHFLLGMSFFLYLPLLPLVLLFCSWRRRVKARKRLLKKANRKKLRMIQKKRAALTAMKGLMIQEDLTIDDALKVMEEGQRVPDRSAPMLPPKLLVVSSSSDTDKNEFNYTSSSEDIPENYIAAMKKKSPLVGPPKQRAATLKSKKGSVAGKVTKRKRGAKQLAKEKKMIEGKTHDFCKDQNSGSKKDKTQAEKQRTLGHTTKTSTKSKKSKKTAERSNKSLTKSLRKSKGLGLFGLAGKKSQKPKGQHKSKAGHSKGGYGEGETGDYAHHKDNASSKSSHSNKSGKKSSNSASTKSVKSVHSKSSHDSHKHSSKDTSSHSSSGKGSNHTSYSSHSTHSRSTHSHSGGSKMSDGSEHSSDERDHTGSTAITSHTETTDSEHNSHGSNLDDDNQSFQSDEEDSEDETGGEQDTIDSDDGDDDEDDEDDSEDEDDEDDDEDYDDHDDDEDEDDDDDEGDDDDEDYDDHDDDEDEDDDDDHDDDHDDDDHDVDDDDEDDEDDEDDDDHQSHSISISLPSEPDHGHEDYDFAGNDMDGKTSSLCTTHQPAPSQTAYFLTAR